MEPISLTIFAVCALFGARVVSKAYNKNTKYKREKLELKGKSLEEAREDNKNARQEEKKLKEELEKQNEENQKLEKELEQARNKLNDPNLSEDERAQWRRKIVTLEDQLSDGKNNSQSLLNQLKKVGERIGNNSKIISGIGLNTGDRHWIRDLPVIEIAITVAVLYVVYKMLKSKEEK